MKRFSQNHLVDGEVLDSIIASAALVPGRRVLEIGPGIGILTAALLRAQADVTAVEVDRRLAAHLRALRGDPGSASRGGDFRSVPRHLVAAPWDLVANLLYHHQPRPALVLVTNRAPAVRADAPARGRGAGGGACAASYLGVRPVPRGRRCCGRAAWAFERTGRVRRPGRRHLPWRLDPPEQTCGGWSGRLPRRRKMLHNVLPRQRRRWGVPFVAALEAATPTTGAPRP
jgi:SAM-dependent methyltransferase